MVEVGDRGLARQLVTGRVGKDEVTRDGALEDAPVTSRGSHLGEARVHRIVGARDEAVQGHHVMTDRGHRYLQPTVNSTARYRQAADARPQCRLTTAA